MEKHDHKERITHLKLQKLVYYAQGATLAIHNKTLFSEDIHAWSHGPVCPELYNYFRHTKDLPNLQGIKQKNAIKLFYQNPDLYQTLTALWNAFGKHSGWMLENMTHQETPWLDAIRQGNNTVITPVAMRKYFIQFLPGCG